MAITITQRNATRNQSTVDYSRSSLLIRETRTDHVTFLNNTGAELVAETGLLVLRNSADASQCIFASAGATLENVIGVLVMDGTVTLANGESTSALYCMKGDIDSNLLILPDTVTLDTITAGKTLKDRLTGLGFVLKSVTETKNFDN